MIRLLTVALVFTTGLTALAQEATISELQELLPDIGVKAIEDRQNAQTKWEKLCYPLGRPGGSEREAVCRAMANMLKAPKTKFQAKLFIMKQLERVGGEEVVGQLAEFLLVEQGGLRDSARRALANNPSPAATKALIDAFGKAEKDADKRVLVNAIGYRGDKAAAEFLASLIENNKGPVVKLAVSALGRVADQDPKLIRKSADKDALLNQADQLAANGNRKAAMAIYVPLAKNLEDSPFGTAAFRGVLELSDETVATSLIAEALSEDNRQRRQVAMAHIRTMPDQHAERVAVSLEAFREDVKVAALTALGTRPASANNAKNRPARACIRQE